MPETAFPRRDGRHFPAGAWRFSRFHGPIHLSYFTFASFGEATLRLYVRHRERPVLRYILNYGDPSCR